MNRAEFVKKVQAFIEQRCRPLLDGCVLVALSGGADSVALLRVLLELGCNCVAAHCNFHLRGAESVRDENFVCKLCDELDVPLRVRQFDVEGYRREHHGISVEMACRELRYAWFADLLKTDNCSCVAVAHHIDDNIETMFLNMLRGTGIAGMVGMKPCQGRVVRPLLCVSRDDVEAYLNEIGQGYVTDSTNLTNDYRRNKVRNVLLKDIDKEFPQGRDRISDTMQNLSEWRELCGELIDDVVDSCRVPMCASGKDEYLLSGLKHYPHPKLLLHAMLSPYGFSISQCEQIEALIANEEWTEKAHFYTSTNAVTVTSESIVVENIKSAENIEVKVDLGDVSKLPVKLEVLHCELPFDATEIDGKFTVAFGKELLDCKHIVLRRWRYGDRMRPYGMRGSRLLSDIFTDAHLTLQDKECQWVLEADGEILWVLGLRAAAAFKVTERSEGYVVLRYYR